MSFSCPNALNAKIILKRQIADARPPKKPYKIHNIINYFDNEMHDLPPLKAIRAFESCYRLRSFTRAAAKLNVGQPAISHQIKQLEKDLGVALFIKRGAQVMATPEADLLYEQIAPALARIAEASRRLRAGSSETETVLATYPGVAAYWASPRLSLLRERKGGFPVRILTAERDIDILSDEADCAIIFGKGDWPGRESLLLMKERVVPVAAPRLAKKLADASAADLLRQGPLIHLSDKEKRWFDWSDWQRRFAPEVTQINRALSVTNHGLAVHQALQGEGIALGWIDIIADLLTGGALVSLHDTALESDRGYWLVGWPGFLESAAGKALRDVFASS